VRKGSSASASAPSETNASSGSISGEQTIITARES
jgi:hypothetical protein